MKTKIFKTLLSLVSVSFFLVLAYGSDDTDDSNSSETSSWELDDSPEEENTSTRIQVDQEQLTMLESYLGMGVWTCTSVESGTAPFMRGATFEFSKGKMFVSSGPTSVENSYTITGIMPNFPEGALLSALITINKNEDMLSAISDDVMVLSWGGDTAKLILQR